MSDYTVGLCPYCDSQQFKEVEPRRFQSEPCNLSKREDVYVKTFLCIRCERRFYNKVPQVLTT